MIIDRVAEKGAQEAKVLNDKIDALLDLEKQCLQLAREMFEFEKLKLQVHYHCICAMSLHNWSLL